MSRIVYADFSAPDAKTRNLVERMNRFDLVERLELIQASFSNLVIRSRFSLADQVLLHALVSSGLAFELVHTDNKGGNIEQSLVAITREAYGLQVTSNVDREADLIIDSEIRINDKSSFAGKDVLLGKVAVNPVADWSYDELVQYVLDHEVPVNPIDMPGFKSRVA